MKRFKLWAISALAILSLAVAGCQDTGTTSSTAPGASTDALQSIPAMSDAALPSESAP